MATTKALELSQFSSGLIVDEATDIATLGVEVGVDELKIGNTTVIDSARNATFTGFTSTGIDDNATATTLTITADGHIGVGVPTPSAWGGIADNVLEFAGGGHIFGVANDNYFSIGSNTYYDGTVWRYKTAGVASTMYHQDAGRHEFFTSPIATSANQEITTTIESLEINASGNLDVKTKLAVGYSDFTNIPTNGAAFLGNVGIGTNDPQAKLHIRDGIIEDVSGSIIRMDLSGINPFWEIQATNGGTSANRKLNFYAGGGANTNVMTLTQAGNVGIGITAPLTKLQVVGTTLLSSASTYGASTAAISVFNGSSSANYYKADNHYWQLASGTDTLTINSAGNVGIGNTSPQAKLDVLSGSGIAGGMYVAVTGETYGPNSISARASVYDVAGTVLRVGAHANGVNTGALINFNAYNSTDGATGAYVGAVAGPTGNGPANFVIGRRTSTQAWAESLRVDTSGNVGIGTTSPQAKLHIDAGSGAISIRDYKSIVYNLDASIPEGATYQRFSIGINTALTTFPRTAAYVKVTVVPNPDGGIGLVHSSTAEFNIWRVDGNNNADFKIVNVDNGTIGIATPVASGNTILFGFTMPNNGTGTTPTLTIKIEIIARDVANYVITPITGAVAHTGTVLSGYKIITSGTTPTKVGIGTTSPYTALHVAGGHLIANVADTAVTDSTTDSKNTGFGFKVAAGNVLGALINSTANGNWGADINFNVRNSSGGTFPATPAMVVKSFGNVGINTTNPTQKLTVIGEIALGANASSQSSRISIADGLSGATDARFLFRNGTDTNAALRLVLNSADNVSLDAIQANNSAVQKNLLLQANGGNIFIATTSNTGGGRIDITGNATAVIQARSTTAGTGDGTADVTVTRAVTSGAQWWANARYDAFSHTWGYGGGATASTAMRITGSGNLAIGTTSNTTEKLNVNGALWLLGSDDANYSTLIGPRYDSGYPFTMRTRNNDSTAVEFLGIYADSGGANNRISLGSGGWPVCIGSTSGENRLSVIASGGSHTNGSLPSGITIYSGGTGNETGTALTFKDGLGPQGVAGVASFRRAASGGYARDLRFYVNNQAVQNGFQEALRITPDRKLGFGGVSDAQYSLHADSNANSSVGHIITGAVPGTANYATGAVLLHRLGQGVGFQFSGNFIVMSWTGSAYLNLYITARYNDDNIAWTVIDAPAPPNSSIAKTIVKLCTVTYSGASYLALVKDGGGTGNAHVNAFIAGSMPQIFEASSGTYTITTTHVTLN